MTSSYAKAVERGGADGGCPVVDARGHRCPVPTLRLRKAMGNANEVRLLADDPMARIDVPHFAGQAGLTIVEIVEEAGSLSFLVRR